MIVEKSNSFHQLLEGGQYNPILIDVDSEDVTEDRTDVWASIRTSEAETARIRTRDRTRNKDLGNDNDNGNKVTVEDKGKDPNSPPRWNFQCVREIENAKRARIEKMGVFPAFDADMGAVAAQYGAMAAEGRAFLASLGGDSSDDERCRQISVRRAQLGKRE